MSYKPILNTVRFGSGLIYVKPKNEGEFCLGSMNGVKFQEQWEEKEVKAHNTGTLIKKIKGHKTSITGDLLELNFVKLQKIRGGIDIIEAVPADMQMAQQIFEPNTTEANRLYKFNRQNYDKSLLNVASVKQGTTTLTPDTDYETLQNDRDETGIRFIFGSAYDPTKKTTINHEVMELARLEFHSGGKTTIEELEYARIVNEDENKKKFEIKIYRASNTSGIEMDFKDPDGDEPNSIGITLSGTKDLTKEPGKQLFVITDEQGV